MWKKQTLPVELKTLPVEIHIPLLPVPVVPHEVGHPP